MRLNLKQTLALDFLEDNETSELLYGGAAGGGKSIMGCYWQLKRRFKYPGTRGLIGRSQLKTLKETTLQSFFEVARMQGLKADTHFKYNQQSNIILFPNGSLIYLKDLFQYPSDPNFDELGSLEITDCFIDEANQITEKARNIVKSRIRYRLDENGLIPKCLYTCNPAKNWVYSDFYRPDKDGSLLSHRKFIHALVDDNPDVSKYYRDNLLQLDKNSKERLLFGNWEYDDDPSVLMDYDKILDIFTNTHVSEGEGKITSDIARFGGDRIVIIEWKGWRGKVKAYQRQGLDVSAEKIEQSRKRLGCGKSDILVDEDGVGGGIVDFYGCKGFVNNSRPLPSPEAKGSNKDILENFDNLKSQCYFRLAKRINENGLYLECEDESIKQLIIEELEQVKQKDMDKDGKKAVIPKDKMKEVLGRSPDFADTIMMREWFDLKPKKKLVYSS